MDSEMNKENMVMEQRMVLMVGNIGSGKSTLAAKFAKKGYVAVNSDRITTMVQGGDYGRYDPKKKSIYHNCELATIETAIIEGFSVVVDRTNMKRSDRERFIKIADRNNIPVDVYNFGAGIDSALMRRIKNPLGIKQGQWIGVWKRMVESFQEPSNNEGIRNIINASGLKYYFRAVDFDGTICDNNFPEIGEPKSEMIDKIRMWWANLYNMIIIWTCRSGDYEAQMKAWLIENDVPFDYINENPVIDYGSRKIFAHEYWDDRNRPDWQGGNDDCTL